MIILIEKRFKKWPFCMWSVIYHYYIIFLLFSYMKKTQDHLKVLSCARDGLMQDRSCTVCWRRTIKSPLLAKKRWLCFWVPTRRQNKLWWEFIFASLMKLEDMCHHCTSGSWRLILVCAQVILGRLSVQPIVQSSPSLAPRLS